MTRLSVIVPMRNEERTILAALRAVRAGAPQAEIIVVDGGSHDCSRELARTHCDRLLESPPGRARQMNAGAALASGDVFGFVHADTIVPRTYGSDIEAALTDPLVSGGRFDVELDNPALHMRLLGYLISQRSRLTRIGTGDQAIFARRSVFESLGGFPEIELCEDLEFSRQLRRAGQVACIRSRVLTSARRWNRDGVAATVLRMWAIKFLFFAGVNPALLKSLYADRR
ncbi:MAG: TIGR04283 family arsenosugar biosynthesis glycosyltransferase [Candidatus Binataceae bacterium]